MKQMNNEKLYSDDYIQLKITRENSSIIADKNEQVNRRYYYLFMKRFCDVVLSVIGLIFLQPVFLIVAFFIKLDSHGPIIFAHKRVGMNHKTINLYKFRTMVDHSEEIMQNFTPEQQKEYKQNFKIKNDPRITKIGRILRKTSLDELPQLLNILLGDISFVGPRPVVEEEIKKYGDNTERFLSVKPGLTGYWQINGRSDTTYEQRVMMDMEYIDTCSMRMDIKIILLTIPAVLKRRGSY